MQEYVTYIASYLQNSQIVELLLDMRDIYGPQYLLFATILPARPRLDT